MKWNILAVGLALALVGAASATDYPAPQAPVIPDGAGYVSVPGALVPADPQHDYKAIINAEHAASSPSQPLGALESDVKNSQPVE